MCSFPGSYGNRGSGTEQASSDTSSIVPQLEALRFELERKTEPMDMELSRLLRKPRKRNGIGFV